MNFGLTQKEFDYILKTVINPLKLKGAKLYFFGSRANGTFQKFSDLDLMVESEKDLSLIISHIKETLSKSNFPYKVDIVPFNDFASSYLKQFEKEKILL